MYDVKKITGISLLCFPFVCMLIGGWLLIGPSILFSFIGAAVFIGIIMIGVPLSMGEKVFTRRK